MLLNIEYLRLFAGTIVWCQWPPRSRGDLHLKMWVIRGHVWLRYGVRQDGGHSTPSTWHPEQRAGRSQQHPSQTHAAPDQENPTKDQSQNWRLSWFPRNVYLQSSPWWTIMIWCLICVIFLVATEDVNNFGVRFRLYGCERMRRERMIGETVMGFASLRHDTATTHWLTLEPRSNLSVSVHLAFMLRTFEVDVRQRGSSRAS